MYVCVDICISKYYHVCTYACIYVYVCVALSFRLPAWVLLSGSVKRHCHFDSFDISTQTYIQTFAYTYIHMHVQTNFSAYFMPAANNNNSGRNPYLLAFLATDWLAEWLLKCVCMYVCIKVCASTNIYKQPCAFTYIHKYIYALHCIGICTIGVHVCMSAWVPVDFSAAWSARNFPTLPFMHSYIYASLSCLK